MTSRVFYTGDMANQSGWFQADGDMEDPNAKITLREEPGPLSEDRTIHVFRRHIGDRYFGHCNPRFVTAEAHAAYYRRWEGL